jgi:hypothetical protein
MTACDTPGHPAGNDRVRALQTIRHGQAGSEPARGDMARRRRRRARLRLAGAGTITV